MFNQHEFNQFIIDHKLIGFFDTPITLKSGRLSNWYVNWRTAVEDAFLTDQLTDFVLEFAKDNNITADCFYGVPEGATKLGVLTQYKWAKSQPDFSAGKYTLAMGRAKPKEHGDPKDKFFVGMPKGKTVIVEDVTTTGGSLLTTVDTLQNAGVDIIAAIGLTNRNEKRDDGLSVAEALAQKNVTYFAMSNARELLQIMYDSKAASEANWNMAQDYFKQYGT